MEKRLIIYRLLSVFSIGLSVVCFGVFIASCAGHPPTAILGMWIMPLSFFGGTIFMYLSAPIWRLGRHGGDTLQQGVVKRLLKKTGVFTLSFLAGGLAYIAFIMVGLALLADRYRVSDDIFQLLNISFVIIAIAIGALTYRRLLKYAI